MAEDLLFYDEGVVAFAEMNVLVGDETAVVLDVVTRDIAWSEDRLMLDEMLVDVLAWSEEGVVHLDTWVRPPPVSGPRLQRGVRFRVELEEP